MLKAEKYVDWPRLSLVWLKAVVLNLSHVLKSPGELLKKYPALLHTGQIILNLKQVQKLLKTKDEKEYYKGYYNK